jgi:hypothetical protein
MDWLEGVVAIGFGLLIRMGIPILITILLVRWLRRLDERWQSEAKAKRSPVSDTARAINIGCWEIKGCSAEQTANCRARANLDTPCWQLFRGSDGHLQERCIGCEVFRKSPLPVPVTTT